MLHVDLQNVLKLRDRTVKACSWRLKMSKRMRRILGRFLAQLRFTPHLHLRPRNRVQSIPEFLNPEAFSK